MIVSHLNSQYNLMKYEWQMENVHLYFVFPHVTCVLPQEQNQESWKLYFHTPHVCIWLMKSNNEASPVRNSYEYNKKNNTYFLAQGVWAMNIVCLNSKSDEIVIAGLFTEFSVYACPYTFTVKSLSINLRNFPPH